MGWARDVKLRAISTEATFKAVSLGMSADRRKRVEEPRTNKDWKGDSSEIRLNENSIPEASRRGAISCVHFCSRASKGN